MAESKRQFKVSLEDDVRRFRLSEPLTLSVLQKKLRSLFSINADQKLRIRWKDEENDMITVADDADLMDAATSLGPVARLYLTVLDKVDIGSQSSEACDDHRSDTSSKECDIAGNIPDLTTNQVSDVPSHPFPDHPQDSTEDEKTPNQNIDMPNHLIPDHLEESREDGKVVHQCISCDVTGMYPLIGVRWHRVGDDYDVCQEAFEALSEEEKKQFEKIAVPGATPVPYGKIIIHPGVECDVSGMYPIEGNRWHRMGVNYDLCEEEFEKLPEKERLGYQLITHPGASPLPYGYPIRFDRNADPAEQAAALLRTVLTALNEGFDIDVGLIPRGSSTRGPPAPSSKAGTASSAKGSERIRPVDPLEHDAVSGRLTERFVRQAAAAAAETYLRDDERRRCGRHNHPWGGVRRQGQGFPGHGRCHGRGLHGRHSKHNGEHGHDHCHRRSSESPRSGFYHRLSYISPGDVLPVGTIKPGNHGGGVAQLQAFLKTHGLMEGTGDEHEVYGPATATAIRKFQRSQRVNLGRRIDHQGEHELGVYNKATRDALLALHELKTTTSTFTSCSKARALYAYKTENNNEVGFDSGDLFEVLDSSSRWWKVVHQKTNKVGWVPSNYVEIIDSTSLFAENIHEVGKHEQPEAREKAPAGASMDPTALPSAPPTSVTETPRVTTISWDASTYAEATSSEAQRLRSGPAEEAISMQRSTKESTSTSTENGLNEGAGETIATAPQVVETPHQFQHQLEILRGMGFTDTTLIVPLLERLQGSVTDVLEELCPEM